MTVFGFLSAAIVILIVYVQRLRLVHDLKAAVAFTYLSRAQRSPWRMRWRRADRDAAAATCAAIALR